MQSVGGHEELKAFIDQNGRFPDQMLAGPPEVEGFRLVVGNTVLYWGLSQAWNGHMDVELPGAQKRNQLVGSPSLRP